VPHFAAFPGLRFAPTVSPAAVLTPPYDVISAGERAALAARDPHNMVHIDVPGAGGYARAGALLAAWQRDGVLVRDATPSLYPYRMRWTDEAGSEQRTLGVFGSLRLEPPGAGDVLPHERTTPKDATDRLELLRATDANLSAVWGLSMAAGLGAACAAAVEGIAPLMAHTDDDGVVHELWRVDDPAGIATIGSLVAGAAVVIADGHHRYQTCLAYHHERDRAGVTNGHEATLAFVVELAPEHLHVQAIHRLLDLDAATLADHLSGCFDVVGRHPVTPRLLAHMVEHGCLALIGAPDEPATLVTARPGAFPADLPDLDSARLEHALGLGTASAPTVRFQHGFGHVVEALRSRSAASAVLLRPVPVATIESMARARALMPPKSTFFAPKPRTGVVLRTF
jgi:uncharacterized protein (DUF1015 family)